MVGRRKEAFDLDGRVYRMGKRVEFPLVHIAAMELGKAMAHPRCLGGAFRDRKHQVILMLFYLVSDDHGPGQILKRAEEAGDAFFRYGKTRNKVLGGHAGDLSPDDLVEVLGGRPAVFFLYRKKPEAVHHPVMPQEEVEVCAKPGGIHGLEYAQVYGLSSFDALSFARCRPRDRTSCGRTGLPTRLTYPLPAVNKRGRQ